MCLDGLASGGQLWGGKNVGGVVEIESGEFLHEVAEGIGEMGEIMFFVEALKPFF